MSEVENGELPVEGAVAQAAEVAAETNVERSGHRRTIGRAVLAAGAGILIGGGAGYFTPTHVEIAGSHIDVYPKLNQPYTDIDIGVDVKIPQHSSSFGARLEVQTLPSFEVNGKFDVGLFKEYLQLNSDSEQLHDSVTTSVERHLLFFALGGLFAGLGAYGLGHSARQRYQGMFDQADRDKHAQYVRPYKQAGAAMLAAGVLLYSSLPSEDMLIPSYPPLRPTTGIQDVPGLQGAEVSGPLAFFINMGGEYVTNYIQTYISDNNRYYNDVRTAARAYIDSGALPIPKGPRLRTILFRTDQHCNIGMDRVEIEIMKELGLHTLVSAGDDDFSGSFSFEASCTSDIAARAKKAGIHLVVAPGNHDSKMTADFERKQGFSVLDNNIITVNDAGALLRFGGSPDPRASRYAQGIQPASPEAQLKLTTEQGAKIGKLACSLKKPLIVVTHDPTAGTVALHTACNYATSALNGHTHMHFGPVLDLLPNGQTAYELTGGSAGGAPKHGTGNFLTDFTLGQLQNPAHLDLITYNTDTMKMVADTEVVIQPNKVITSEQLLKPTDITPPGSRPSVSLTPTPVIPGSGQPTPGISPPK